jgi:hypothetical protein
MATKKTTHWIKSHVRSPLRIYFLIMSLVGVIWTLVAFWILAFSIGKQVIITDNEYVLGDRYYEIENCQYNNQYDNNGQQDKLTQEEITTCEERKKITLIQSRKVMFKEDVLGWIIWGMLFLVLLLVHYPRFMKFTEKN